MIFSKAWKWFVEALFPAKCLICYREGKYLCRKHYKFKPAPPSRAVLNYLDEILAAVAYDDLIARKVVEFFKFRGISDIAEIMSNEIINQHQKTLKNSILIPIPLYWTRKIWRGFNQAEILAFKISQKMESVDVLNLLKRIKRTKQQARLNKHERLKNTANAFVCLDEFSAKFSNKQIILIDDVVASGATLDAAAKTLQNAGFKNIKAVVFARGGKI